MKSYISTILLVSAFLLTAGLATANAQVDTDSVFRVKIPFSFAVRNKRFPPGEYIIQTPVQNTTESGVLQIESVKGKMKSAMFNSIPITAKEAPRDSNVVFGKVGGKFYLSEIWQSESMSGSQVEEPHMKALEKSGLAKEKQVIRAEMTRKAKH